MQEDWRNLWFFVRENPKKQARTQGAASGSVRDTEHFIKTSIVDRLFMATRGKQVLSRNGDTITAINFLQENLQETKRFII